MITSSDTVYLEVDLGGDPASVARPAGDLDAAEAGVHHIHHLRPPLHAQAQASQNIISWLNTSPWPPLHLTPRPKQDKCQLQ